MLFLQKSTKPKRNSRSFLPSFPQKPQRTNHQSSSPKVHIRLTIPPSNHTPTWALTRQPSPPYLLHFTLVVVGISQPHLPFTCPSSYPFHIWSLYLFILYPFVSFSHLISFFHIFISSDLVSFFPTHPNPANPVPHLCNLNLKNNEAKESLSRWSDTIYQSMSFVPTAKGWV